MARRFRSLTGGLSSLGLGGLLTLVVAWPALAEPMTPVDDPEAETLTAPALSQDEPWPPTKNITLMVEGEPQQETFQLYSHPDYPLTTYYPTDMTVENACDANGCAVAFSSRQVGAVVLFLFPTQTSTAAAVTPYILGTEGLLAENGWIVTGDYPQPEQVPYPWVQQIITFQEPDWAVIGSAYIGEIDDRGFAVVSFFPPDAGDGYAPRIGAILREMEIR